MKKYYLVLAIISLGLFSCSSVSAKSLHRAPVKKHVTIKHSSTKYKRAVGKIVFPWTFAPTYALSGTITTLNPFTVATATGTAYTSDMLNTKLVSRYGFILTPNDLFVGDHVELSGAITGTSVSTTQIRDLESYARHGIFSGTITSLNGSSFTLLPNGASTSSLITVTTDPSTLFTVDSVAGNIDRLTPHDTVLITGTTDRSGTFLKAETIAATHAASPRP